MGQEGAPQEFVDRSKRECGCAWSCCEDANLLRRINLNTGITLRLEETRNLGENDWINDDDKHSMCGAAFLEPRM